MILKSAIAKIVLQEDVNFLLTNRIPRRLATRFMGWFSRIEQPIIRDISIAVWKLFADLDLRDADTRHFRSLHDCFIRRLKPGSRPVDPDPGVLTSPCDAIVGALGQAQDGMVLQIKGLPYQLSDLLRDVALADRFKDAQYVTMRLTSAMYHRFHAPHDCHVDAVTHVSGDTWNVNPIALKRVERLFCRNERALIHIRLQEGDHSLLMVPVAAILVAGIRLGWLGPDFNLREWASRTIRCDVSLRKGEEMGWFEHGSTIILFAPAGFQFADAISEGAVVRVGQALMHLPPRDTAASGS